MILDKHVWRTEDDRLVWDGDRDAAILAYPAFTEIPDELARQLGLLDEPEPEHEPEPETPVAETDAESEAEPDTQKAKPAPPDKARRRSADKAAG